MDFLQIILSPFSWLLKNLADIFGSYGFALILFALIVKIILFPLSLKGKRSMISMNLLSGRMKEIQKRCGNDKERYNREVQELYAKEKINPMGGCLWSLLPIPFLMVLYAVIRRPFRYLMNMTDSAIITLASALGWSNFSSSGYNELELASWLNSGNLANAETVAGSSLTVLNFHFLGIDLAQIPSWKFWDGGISWNSVGLFLLPIISAVFGLLAMVVSNKTNKMNQQAMENPQMKSMMFMSPLISLWIGFTLPAALCVYWISNNVLQMLQELICGKLLKKDYEKALAAQAEQARLEKEEEKLKKQQIADKRAAAAEENKNKKNKKAPAPVKKNPGVNTADSRVGLRAYARGRSYDPSRYGGATAYKDPNFKVDEEAIQTFVDAKSEHQLQAGLNEQSEAEADVLTAEEYAELPAAESAEFDSTVEEGEISDSAESEIEHMEDATDTTNGKEE
ncbi:MAG: Inner rane protein translocase component YidC, long form [Oscillospiraceae bacterium]|nr:Inner rane protein translocase component YidC, long form [Oscillospiraceae bacterium]